MFYSSSKYNVAFVALLIVGVLLFSYGEFEFEIGGVTAADHSTEFKNKTLHEVFTEVVFHGKFIDNMTHDEVYTHEFFYDEKKSKEEDFYTEDADEAEEAAFIGAEAAFAMEEDELNKAAEHAFYKHHHDEMVKISNDSNIEMMVWGVAGGWNKFNWPRGLKIRIDPSVTSFDDIPDIQKARYIHHGAGLCANVKLFLQHRSKPGSIPIPHVYLTGTGRDFGEFGYRNIAQMEKQGCSREMIMEYINHEDTLAVFTNQDQDIDHPKVTSIPLGVQGFDKAHLVEEFSPDRPALLMVNYRTKNRGMRFGIDGIVGKNFRKAGVPYRNTYGTYAKEKFYIEMRNSKFILSPRGIGTDCYRHWESLYRGIIPVFVIPEEKHDGWASKTFTKLPVVIAKTYEEITPQFLEEEYARLVHHTRPEEYEWQRLTVNWWKSYAESFVAEYEKKHAAN